MNWWFGRKSAAPAVRPFVPPWLVDGEARGFARGYAAQLEEVFRTNPVGQRSVRLVSSMIGGLPIFAAEGPDEAVALLAREGLLEGLGAALLLHGNAFVQLVVDGHDRPGELHALRPERVSVAADAAGWPSGYVYRTGAKAARVPARDALGRRQVAHLRSLNPGDDHYGLGCLDAAIGAASVHNRASLWNKALLDNAARPSGALVYEPGDGSALSGEQFDRLKSELAEQFSGSGNAGRPLLLDGGLKWHAMSLTPADMDFVALKEGAARDIALAFGVPPVLVGLPGDATYANAREAGRALYRQTVLPMASRMLAGLSELLSDWLGPVRFEVDQDQISELSEDRARLWEQVATAEFLSRDEKRVQLGFEATTSLEQAGEGQ
ncbi:MAG: phage portal protein [Pseudomonadota bacterium]|nr:phage portal protein [Pseudomonadota bacterium]